MKKLRLLFSMLCVCALSLTMSSQTTLIAFVADSDGPVTNIRSAPNGKIVAKLPTSKVYRMWVKNARNGWWQVSTVEEGENARTVVAVAFKSLFPRLVKSVACVNVG